MRRHLLLGCAVLIGLLAASCSDDTVQPAGPVEPTIDRIEVGSVPGSAQGDLPGTQATMPTYPSTTATIRPALGGVLAAGRYRLVIPPLALTQTTTVTLRVREDLGFMCCELLPHGLTFRVPVVLSMDLMGTCARAGEDYRIYYLDETTGRWLDMGGSLDPTSLLLSTGLPHFSKYGPGRAGW